MSKQQLLLTWRVGIAAIIASGFIFSFPAFTGTIFPFLGVCFQATTFLVLIGCTFRARKQQKEVQPR